MYFTSNMFIHKSLHFEASFRFTMLPKNISHKIVIRQLTMM